MLQSAAVGAVAAAPHNQRLQLSGATFKEAIAVRLLQVHFHGTLTRAFESAACS